jgi:hypothetical protein
MEEKIDIRKECEKFINDRPSLINAIEEQVYVDALIDGLCEFVNKLLTLSEQSREARLQLPDRIKNAVLSSEYSHICLRDERGQLLWSESQPSGKTIEDILEYADKTANNRYLSQRKGEK